MIKKSKRKAYSVKLRVVHENKLIKMSPPFIQGVVIATNLKDAEETAIKELMNFYKGTESDKISLQTYKTTLLRSDFIMSST